MTCDGSGLFLKQGLHKKWLPECNISKTLQSWLQLSSFYHILNNDNSGRLQTVWKTQKLKALHANRKFVVLCLPYAPKRFLKFWIPFPADCSCAGWTWPLLASAVNIAQPCVGCFIALCWPRVRSVRQSEQPSSVCLSLAGSDTVAAVQTADSCISPTSSICYLESSDFITTEQCSCTLWLSPGLSARSIRLPVTHSSGLHVIGSWWVS